MTKITKEVLFTELSIKLAIMDAKLDKLLELAMKPEITIKPFIEILPEDIKRARELFKDLESTTDYDLTKPYGFTHGDVK
ncbi:hypothetical protein [Robertmurraya sp.]|uniref:hypothetical protein n=1 Tax=Robertmurraya sp. TaxID=2837525 RepID=UPI0037047A39